MLFQSFAGHLQSDGTPGTLPEATEKEKGSSGPVVLISILAAAGVGVGGFFLIRRAQRERHAADSIITQVERTWKRSVAHYAAEEYRDAIRELQSITACWYTYEKYSTKYRRRGTLHPDSIKAVIASCDFLERMIPEVTSLTRYAERLPGDEFAFSKLQRQDILTARKHLRTAMDSIISIYPNHRKGLQYSFRHINRKLHTVDSLIEATYTDRKADFTLKNRFYYNRAVAAGDSAALLQFVDDCEYYQVDKEWCQRAKLALQGQGGSVTNGMATTKKMSPADSIEAAFQRAIQSKRIEVLEAYIKKYSSRKYRSRRRLTKINEVKAALRLLQNEIAKELAFNKAYPRFGNSDFSGIVLSVKGLARRTEDVFRAAWDSLERDVGRIPDLRFPASVYIDYTAQPPTIMLDAVVSPRHDIERTETNSRPTFRVTSLIPAMQVLNRFRKLTVELLEKKKTGVQNADDLIDYQVRKVNLVTYVVRLRTPDGRNAVLFYAKTPEKDGDDDPVQFYDFYDLSTNGGGGVRFPIYPGSLPDVIPSLSADTLELRMGTEFFGD